MNDAGQKHRLVTGICLVLALVTVGLYWPMTRHQFIDFDDQQYITQNPHVTPGLTWSGVVWAFRSGYVGNWHPLTWMSHMLDCQLFGLNPGGHHLTNLFFHIANTLLLFLLLLRMTGATWRSAFVAALFAWHPLHVESVAWASERKDVLSTFFFLLTLLTYVRYVDQPGRARYLLALALFALGLMSKPMIVTLPFVLLLIDFWPLKRVSGFEFGISSSGAHGTQLETRNPKPGTLLLEKLPFFALTAAASVATYLVQKTGGAVSSFRDIPLPVRVANALLAYWRYISKTFWPADLAAIYPYSNHWPIGLTLAAALLLIVWSGLFLLWAKRHPYLVTGWFWFLGTLVPTIGLVQVGLQAMADRYTYIPSIGLFILITWGVNDLLESRLERGKILAFAGTAALAVCLVCTSRQLRYWRDGEKLFRHAIEVTTDNYIAYTSLGKALDDSGHKDEALAFYYKSVQLEPHFPEGQYNLGTALSNEGRLEEAVRHLAAAVQDNPNFQQAQNNLGNALLKEGNLDEAAAHLTQAVRLEPDDAEAHYNLGTVLSAQSKLDDAVVQFSEALKLKPDYWQAHANLAVALMREGKASEATVHFAEAVRLNPENPAARFNLGLAYLDQNQPAEAAAQFSEVLRLRPGDAAAHYRLAAALARQHKSREAISHYHEALRLNPDFAEALNELAWILATDPNPEIRSGQAAVQLAERACELTQHGKADMIATLAAAYAEAGRFSDAVATAQKARDIAVAAGQKEVAAKAEALQKLYQSGRPFRETF